MGKPVNKAIAIMITAATIPALEPGIGAKLNHPMRQGCPGIRMPMPACANKGIYILTILLGP